MKRYLGELIKQKYGADDLPLSDFTGEVIRAYEVYLKTEKEAGWTFGVMDCIAKVLSGHLG